jgi:D-alanyl-D-alanine carboxypeptidase
MPQSFIRRAAHVAVTLSAVAFLTAGAQSPPPKGTVNRLVDSLAAHFVATHGAPGISIAVVRRGDTLVMGGWGKADLENDVPATARTVYRIGSITKQFTSSAVMQLVEQGKVKLDDSIGTYLPTLPTTWRGASVRQLLNHTSGVPSYTDIGMRWVKRWAEEMIPDTLIALTAKDTMWFKPGTSWQYDNSGYVVLGMLIEKLTGHTWATDITERHAKPLGLSDTQNCMVQPVIPRRAQGYSDVSGTWMNSPYLAMSQPYAAGALCSTVGDLARWDQALGSGKVVSPAAYVQMTTPVGAAAKSRYGFGLTRDSLEGHVLISHGGGIPGFISANAWFPEDRMSVTVLTNSGSARADYLMAQVARAALGLPLQRVPTRVTITAAERAQYVGTFSLVLGGAARDFTFFERDGELYGQVAGQPANVLIPAGHDTFGASFDPSLRIIFSVENGKATKMTLKQGGQSFDGARKQNP